MIIMTDYGSYEAEWRYKWVLALILWSAKWLHTPVLLPKFCLYIGSEIKDAE